MHWLGVRHALVGEVRHALVGEVRQALVGGNASIG